MWLTSDPKVISWRLIRKFCFLMKTAERKRCFTGPCESFQPKHTDRMPGDMRAIWIPWSYKNKDKKLTCWEWCRRVKRVQFLMTWLNYYSCSWTLISRVWVMEKQNRAKKEKKSKTTTTSKPYLFKLSLACIVDFAAVSIPNW